MPSGTATKPGDVVNAMNGKTIEVINTDAEGRLILSDAICYANKEDLSPIVDVATLTGAMMIALGPGATGFFANDERLAERIKAAGDTSGEIMWRFPLIREYGEGLKSNVADIKNTGPRDGGAISAASFLHFFVDDTAPGPTSTWPAPTSRTRRRASGSKAPPASPPAPSSTSSSPWQSDSNTPNAVAATGRSPNVLSI